MKYNKRWFRNKIIVIGFNGSRQFLSLYLGINVPCEKIFPSITIIINNEISNVVVLLMCTKDKIDNEGFFQI